MSFDARTKRLTLLASIVGSSIVFIDGTAVNVALPSISSELDAGLSGQQWVVEAYLLTLSSLLLLGGSLGDLFGRRRTFARAGAGGRRDHAGALSGPFGDRFWTPSIHLTKRVPPGIDRLTTRQHSLSGDRCNRRCRIVYCHPRRSGGFTYEVCGAPSGP